MLPILINYKVIHHTLTYWEIILSLIIPKHVTYSPTCLSVETDDKHCYLQWQKQILLGGASCYSAHQAISKFAEHNIGMVSWVHRKCLYRYMVAWPIRLQWYEWIPDIHHCRTRPFPKRAIVATKKEATAIMPCIKPYIIAIKVSAAP